MSAKIVFLTGATGFVGRHAARRFVAQGWTVRALVRNPGRAANLECDCELIPGDLSQTGSYRGALRGCDAVVNVAGLVKALNLAGYRRVNAEGSEHLARAAADICPEAMFVQVSSQAAAGPARDGRPVTEADAPRPISWYGKSKLEGEQAVAAHFKGPWCAIRPCVVYGAGDPGLLELFQVVQRGWAPIIAGGANRVQMIAVEDLAEVLVRASQRPDLSGRRGFAAVDTTTMGELAREIAAMRTPPATCIPVPAVAMRVAGAFESVRQWFTRSADAFNCDKARETLQDWACDPVPLMRDLLGEEKPESSTRLIHWKSGLRRVCRCYVSDQGLRQNVWSV